jgi:acylphosphatase
MVRATVYLSGTVQQVGCRFATQRAARRLELVGTVKNLDDGRVEIVVEGPEDLIRQLPDEISGNPHIRIVDVEWHFSQAVGCFSGYSILQ